jgi:hypothetical protein
MLSGSFACPSRTIKQCPVAILSLEAVDTPFTSALFWMLAGATFVAAELVMTLLIVRHCTRPTRNPGT